LAAIADIRAALRSKTAVEPPAPWRSRPIWIGGITAVGFAPGTDLLVVLSHNGVGVVDPFTAQTVARSGDDDTYGDHYPVAVAGIGPVACTRIPLAGLWGGGLRTFTPDGWRVAVIAADLRTFTEHCARSREVLAARPLDYLIKESGRHLGHADLLRERVDVVGE
jgi:hypothetical protein